MGSSTKSENNKKHADKMDKQKSGGDRLEPAVTADDMPSNPANANNSANAEGSNNINIGTGGGGVHIDAGDAGVAIGTGANAGNAGVDALQGEVAKLKVLLEAAHDNVLLARADAENARNRAIKDKLDGIKFANKGILTDLLPVIDNLELALAHVSPADNADVADAGNAVQALADGVGITLKQFRSALAKHGVEAMETPAGTPFDPNFHEGLMLENNPDLDDNTVSGTLQKGYTLNGRVMRPAKVKVSKK